MTDLRQAAQLALEALERYQVKRQDFDRFADEITALKAALEQPEQEPVAVDQATMELAESVGLIGPASRTHDLHAAIQRFHDLICVNATIKAAKMAADAIRESTPPAAQPEQEPSQWRDMVVVTLVRESVNKHRARELADHFAAERNNG